MDSSDATVWIEYQRRAKLRRPELVTRSSSRVTKTASIHPPNIRIGRYPRKRAFDVVRCVVPPRTVREQLGVTATAKPGP